MNLSSLLNAKITKRSIQICLGLIWLLDGALQLQHQMFTSAFATQVIAPAGQGQPIPVYGPINFEIHLLLMHPAIYDAIFAIIQLALGFLILNKKTTKIGLWASVAWGLGVWYMGEGLGGLLSGHTTLLVGAPGAALIYAILALGVMPSKLGEEKVTSKKKVTKANIVTKPAYWLAIVWAVFWIGGSIFQITPGQNTVSYVSSTISGNASGAPGWLASLDMHTANVINGFASKPMSSQTNHQTKGHSGYWFILLLFVVQLAVGVGVLFKGIVRKASIYMGIVVSLAFWFVGQSLGAYFSGLATDPNAAPLFILLGIAILGASPIDWYQLKAKTLKLFENIDKKIQLTESKA